MTIANLPGRGVERRMGRSGRGCPVPTLSGVSACGRRTLRTWMRSGRRGVFLSSGWAARRACEGLRWYRRGPRRVGT